MRLRRLRFLIAGFLILAPLLVGLATSYLRSPNRNYTLIDIRSLGNFPFDKETGTLNDIPARFRALDNQLVGIEGTALLYNNDSGPDFQIVDWPKPPWPRTPPLVQERVFVDTAALPAPLPTLAKLRVYGRFHINTIRDPDGTLRELFQIEAQRFVDPAHIPDRKEWLWGAGISSVLLTFALAVAISRSLRRRARIRSDRCAACGYDIRATPSICPECGSSVPSRWR